MFSSAHLDSNTNRHHLYPHRQFKVNENVDFLAEVDAYGEDEEDDKAQEITFSLPSNMADNDLFTINSINNDEVVQNHGFVRRKGGNPQFDYESDNENYELVLVATDGNGRTGQKGLIIFLQDLNVSNGAGLWRGASLWCDADALTLTPTSFLAACALQCGQCDTLCDTSHPPDRPQPPHPHPVALQTPGREACLEVRRVQGLYWRRCRGWHTAHNQAKATGGYRQRQGKHRTCRH